MLKGTKRAVSKEKGEVGQQNSKSVLEKLDYACVGQGEGVRERLVIVE